MREQDKPSNAGDDFGTPEEVCNLLYEFWDGPPDLDPCTGPTAIFRAVEMWHVGALQRTFFENGRRTAFVNMPYSRLAAWTRKCALEYWRGNCFGDLDGVATMGDYRRRLPILHERELIMLPPASTSAGWWKRWVSTADAIAFTERLNFIGAPGEALANARFHSALVYRGHRWKKFRDVMAPITTMFVRPE
jgi:hypothetical protein